MTHYSLHATGSAYHFQSRLYCLELDFKRVCRPLRRISVGMAFAAIAFILAALLQLYIDASKDNSVTVLYQVSDTAVS